MSARGSGGSIVLPLLAAILLGDFIQTVLLGSWVPWLITVGGVAMAMFALRRFT